MIAYTKKKKIFLRSRKVDLKPRVIDKKRRRNNIQQSHVGRNLDILTVEIACFIDQRVLLEEEIKDIKVYLSKESLSDLKKRRNLFNEAVTPRASIKAETPKISALTNVVKVGSITPRKVSSFSINVNKKAISKKQQLQPKHVIKKNLNNIIFDVDNLNQNIVANKFSNLRFLTKFNIDEHLAALSIKNIQGVKQTDAKLFGTKKILKVKKNKIMKGRNVRSRSRSSSMDISERKKGLDIPSADNFRTAYYNNVIKGNDPVKNFTYSDPHMSFENRKKGTLDIKKRRPSVMRKYFRATASEALKLTSDEDLGYSIVTERRSKRNKVLRTTFKMSRRKLIRLSRDTGSIKLIFFAFNKHGKRVDSFSQEVTPAKLFLTERNPPLDFDLNASRTIRGNIYTKIRNDELRPVRFNIYQKSFSKSQNYKIKGFTKTGELIKIPSLGEKLLVDGRVQARKSPLFSKTKTVFQRITPQFQKEEYHNTMATSVASVESFSEQLSCILYVTQNEDDTADLNITNLSEDVYAVLPVKRIAKGQRGNNFQILDNFIDGKFKKYNKVFIRNSEEKNPSYTFTDHDVEDDVIYEYAAILYTRSGSKHISGARFHEKRLDREGLISASSRIVNTAPSMIKQTREPAVEVEFEVILNREEDDVDKIINSIFGDNRSLFNEDLKDIKDASNLLYGVRVHRIDMETGENVFVGSFRGFKQEDSNAQSSTDIPKSYRVNFKDSAPAHASQIYKFDPYIVPPAQVLDKVFISLENIIKNKNKSKSTLNKMLVSKQKIINKSKLSEIGTKYASVIGKKGAISSKKAFLEKNRNDLFLEGVTGDIVYQTFSPSSSDASVYSFEVQESNINSIKTLDRDPKTKRFVPKNLFEIEFSVGMQDVFVDFYVVLKQENKDPNIVIDGAIHSTDTFERINGKNSRMSVNYKYLSESKSSVGLVRYYLFGVTKTGSLVGPAYLGGITLEGE